MRDLYAMYGTEGATSVGPACIMRSTATLIPDIASFSLPGTNIPNCSWFILSLSQHWESTTVPNPTTFIIHHHFKSTEKQFQTNTDMRRLTTGIRSEK
jgi:hypothetical protein